MLHDPNLPVTRWKVMLVDDDLDNLGVAQQYFRFMGAQVEVAKDGVEGLELLQRYTPTFILLDLSMPRMDGWEMLKRLRENAATAYLPVIALTAHALPEDRVRVLAAGFDDYITKPIVLTTLLTGIMDCLSKIDLQPQARSTQPQDAVALPVEPALPVPAVHPVSPSPAVAAEATPAPTPDTQQAAPSTDKQANAESHSNGTDKRIDSPHVIS